MIDDVMSETEERMRATISAFEGDLRGMRSGRASTALVERIIVDYYGQETELRQLANISTPEALQILIRPYDGGALSAIERAIRQANIGANPNTDSGVIRINMPPLTRERRQELVKFLGQRTEDARVALRNIRRDANRDLDEFEREKMISEDDHKRGQDSVQKLTDRYVARVEELSKAKEHEILDV